MGYPIYYRPRVILRMGKYRVGKFVQAIVITIGALLFAGFLESIWERL